MRMRGIQVKTLCKTKNRPDSFVINDLNRCADGTLVVCFSKERNIGIVFVMSVEYHAAKGSAATLGSNGRFSVLIKHGNDFVEEFKRKIHLAPIVNRIDNMPKCIKLEFEMTERLKRYCEQNNLSYSLPDNARSTYDMIIQGKKVQLKYKTKPGKSETGHHGYLIPLQRKSNGIKSPYYQGDNDYYVIELGGYHGKFLFLPECILIGKLHIQTPTQKGNSSLQVFPPDYLDKPLNSHNRTTNGVGRPVKGNWTCHPSLWEPCMFQ